MSLVYGGFTVFLFYLQGITIQENSPGTDAGQYSIELSVSCPAIPQKTKVAPIYFPFLFYNGKSMILYCY